MISLKLTKWRSGESSACMDCRGFWLVLFAAALFHFLAFFFVGDYYENHPPHYDSIGSYTHMFRVLDAVHTQGWLVAWKMAASFSLSWLQGFFALTASPFLSKTPESMQLYNSLCVFCFMIAVYAAARSAGAGSLKAFLLSLMVFLPDTFYNWQGGLLDLQRDPSFVCLLAAAYFMFFAWLWRPSPVQAFLTGVFVSLTVLSRGNAVFPLAAILLPVIALAFFLKPKGIPGRRWASSVWSLLPIGLIAGPNLWLTLQQTIKRYFDPYTSFSFTDNRWDSLAAYSTIPLKLFFGTLGPGGTWIVSLAGFSLLALLLAFRLVKGAVDWDGSILLSRRFMVVLAGGLWSMVATMILICLVLGWGPMSYESAKYPFYPSLIGFFSLCFVIGMSIRSSPTRVGARSKVFLLVCVFVILCGLAVVRTKIRTSDEPHEHVEIAQKVTDLFLRLAPEASVAYLWHDTISLDTVRYYQAKKGVQEVRKFYFTSPDGHLLDFAVGTPPGVDVRAIQSSLKDQLERGAKYVVVNTKPGIYKEQDNPLFIFQHGQPVVDWIEKGGRFRLVYRFSLWKGRLWEAPMAVYENVGF